MLLEVTVHWAGVQVFRSRDGAAVQSRSGSEIQVQGLPYQPSPHRL